MQTHCWKCVVVFVKSKSKSEAWALFNLRFLWIVHCSNVLISQLLKMFTVNNEKMFVFKGYLLHFQKLCQGWNKFPVISQDSFVVIHNRAESTKHCFIRTLVLVSSVRFSSLEILWIIEIVWVLQNRRRKITAQKPAGILYKHFHAHKIISDLFGFYPVSPIFGPSTTLCML